MSTTSIEARSLSKLTLSDRAAAAASLGELFRVSAGARTFTIYLRNGIGYLPVFAVEGDVIRPARPASAFHAMAIALPCKHHPSDDAQDAGAGDANGCHVVLIPPADAGIEPLAAIVCSALRRR